MFDFDKYIECEWKHEVMSEFSRWRKIRSSHIQGTLDALESLGEGYICKYYHDKPWLDNFQNDEAFYLRAMDFRANYIGPGMARAALALPAGILSNEQIERYKSLRFAAHDSLKECLSAMLNDKLSIKVPDFKLSKWELRLEIPLGIYSIYIVFDPVLGGFQHAASIMHNDENEGFCCTYEHIMGLMWGVETPWDLFTESGLQEECADYVSTVSHLVSYLRKQ